MNAGELKISLQEYYDDFVNVCVSVYAVLKDRDNCDPLKIDIEADALEGLKHLFLGSLREAISEKEELSLLNLSSADERIDAIYVYDLDIPDELSYLEEVVSKDNLPLLNLNDKSLSEIKALLIEIGNNVGQIVLYKTMAPVNIFGRTNFFLKKSASRLEKLDEEFLRVSAGFQMMKINDALLVLDLEALEKSFGFHDVIKREAISGCAAIERAALVSNPDVLRELIDDVRYARKFTKVAKASPVIRAGVTGPSIIKFCQNYPALVGKIRFNEAQDRIVLDTKHSKDLFIKLLMDDFLTSELTDFYYMSVAKDSVEAAALAGGDK